MFKSVLQILLGINQGCTCWVIEYFFLILFEIQFNFLSISTILYSPYQCTMHSHCSYLFLCWVYGCVGVWKAEDNLECYSALFLRQALTLILELTNWLDRVGTVPGIRLSQPPQPCDYRKVLDFSRQDFVNIKQSYPDWAISSALVCLCFVFLLVWGKVPSCSPLCTQESNWPISF